MIPVFTSARASACNESYLVFTVRVGFSHLLFQTKIRTYLVENASTSPSDIHFIDMSTPTLLGIPPEVRSIIYRHVYGSQVLIDVVAERNPTFKVNYSRALLLTCKHVSHEAIEVVRAALVLRIQGLSAGWLKTGAPLALRQHMPWIGEVRLVDFENYSRDSDLDSDFDALPSLKIFDVRTHMIKLPNGKLLKFPALNTAEDAQAFFGGSEEANLKVKAKENYLRQNKSVSDAFNAPERKYKLLHSFFVFDDGIRVKGVQKRCLVSREVRLLRSCS